MASRLTENLIFLAIASTALVAVARGQESGALASIPGAGTATGILASSVDGMSRYLAPDGPIQPALTAIGGLPVRGIEMANLGISRISSGLHSGAEGISRAGGNGGNIRMPGMDALESAMPASIASLGGMMHGAIQQKNKFIMGQAERGVQAGERLRSMMQNGLQGMSARSSGPMVGASNMMASTQEAMMKGASQIQEQLKQSLQGHMSRMEGMQGIGENVRNQAKGITRTLSNGLSGTMDHLHKTGEQVMEQIQGGLQQNTKAMAGIVGSMQGSMGNMGQNMQKNLEGLSRHVRNTAQQVHSHLEQAVSGPLSMLQGMMQKGMGGGQGGGRY